MLDLVSCACAERADNTEKLPENDQIEFEKICYFLRYCSAPEV